VATTRKPCTVSGALANSSSNEGAVESAREAASSISAHGDQTSLSVIAARSVAETAVPNAPAGKLIGTRPPVSDPVLGPLT
jgi:hypothetical protein